MTNESIQTGLPPVPDGMFWRVDKSSNGFTNSVVYLFLMESYEYKERFLEQTFFGLVQRWSDGPIIKKERVVRNTNLGPPKDLNPEIIRSAACEIIDIYWAEKEAERLLGDYPPNSLVTNTEEKN